MTSPNTPSTAIPIPPVPSFTALLELRALDLPSRIRNRNYDLPHPDDGRSFSDVLADAEKEQLGCDKQISKLQSLILELRHNRSELQELIKLSRSLSAPVRRLPAEVLSHIFQHCCQKDVINPSLPVAAVKADRTCWELGWVCSPWREAALSNSALWSHITVILSGRSSRGKGALTAQLRRARKAPLTVAVLDTRAEQGYAEDPNNPLFATIIEAAPRFQHLSLRLNKELLEVLGGRETPALRSLQLHTIGELSAPLESFGSLPGLTNVTLYNSWSQVHISNTVRKFSLVDSSTGGSLDGGLSRLSLMTNLVHLHIKTNAKTPVEMINHILLPSVETLVIELRRSEQDNDLSFLAHFFTNITLPALNKLSITSEDPPQTNNSSIWASRLSPAVWRPDVLVDFIQRSSCVIQELNLSGAYETVSSLLAIFRALSSLTTLHLSERPRQQFLTTHLFTALTVGSHVFDEPLLARLSHLKLKVYGDREPAYGGHFVRMLISRWRPTPISSAVVACLDHVGLIGNEDFVYSVMEADEVVGLREAGLKLDCMCWVSR